MTGLLFQFKFSTFRRSTKMRFEGALVKELTCRWVYAVVYVLVMQKTPLVSGLSYNTWRTVAMIVQGQDNRGPLRRFLKFYNLSCERCETVPAASLRDTYRHITSLVTRAQVTLILRGESTVITVSFPFPIFGTSYHFFVAAYIRSTVLSIITHAFLITNHFFLSMSSMDHLG